VSAADGGDRNAVVAQAASTSEDSELCPPVTQLPANHNSKLVLGDDKPV